MASAQTEVSGNNGGHIPGGGVFIARPESWGPAPSLKEPQVPAVRRERPQGDCVRTGIQGAGSTQRHVPRAGREGAAERSAAVGSHRLSNADAATEHEAP